jgi:hypothetical protein
MGLSFFVVLNLLKIRALLSEQAGCFCNLGLTQHEIFGSLGFAVIDQHIWRLA